MDQELLLLITTLMAVLTPGIHGTSYLSFATNNEVSITRSGCRVSKLCVETPDDCDPAGTGPCLFASLASNPYQTQDDMVLSVQLRGESNESVVLGIRPTGPETTIFYFLCGRNSSGDFFFSTLLGDNSTSSSKVLADLNVEEIRYLLQDGVIQCEFDVPDVQSQTNLTSWSSQLELHVQLGTGSISSNDEILLNITITTTVKLLVNSTMESSVNATSAPGINATTDAGLGSSTGMRSTGMRSTGMRSTGMRSTGMHSTGMYTTGMYTTGLGTTMAVTNKSGAIGRVQPQGLPILLAVLTVMLLLRG